MMGYLSRHQHDLCFEFESSFLEVFQKGVPEFEIAINHSPVTSR